ncbi:MAG: hypothetical protein AAFQ98_05180 [Bacteroidota bacterium]
MLSAAGVPVTGFQPLNTDNGGVKLMQTLSTLMGVLKESDG